MRSDGQHKEPIAGDRGALLLRDVSAAGDSLAAPARGVVLGLAGLEVLRGLELRLRRPAPCHRSHRGGARPLCSSCCWSRGTKEIRKDRRTVTKDRVPRDLLVVVMVAVRASAWYEDRL